MSKHGVDKKAVFGAAPSGDKRPAIAADPISYLHLKASWRVRHVQMATPYGWHELTLEELLYVQGKLSQFETMTWNEIFVLAKKQNHDIPVGKLKCEMAKKWREKNMKGQPTLWTLRFSGAERVWGIFSEGAYQILFWDPLHAIYPTTK
jgi:hypothetical protein